MGISDMVLQIFYSILLYYGSPGIALKNPKKSGNGVGLATESLEIFLQNPMIHLHFDLL